MAKTDRTTEWRDWHITLKNDRLIFVNALKKLQSLADEKTDIPWIVRVFENPKYNIMPGSVSLEAHDMIHILLGRGLLPNDEAFTAGYAMGNSYRRVRWWHKIAFLLAQRFLYTGKYRFKKEQCIVFWNALKVGKRMKSVDLNYPVDAGNFEGLVDYIVSKTSRCTIRNLRYSLGIDTNILQQAYDWEKKRFPKTKESVRN